MMNPEPVVLSLNTGDTGAEKHWESREGQTPCLLDRCERSGSERDYFWPFWTSS